jgi:hypothetical protein
MAGCIFVNIAQRKLPVCDPLVAGTKILNMRFGLSNEILIVMTPEKKYYFE